MRATAIAVRPASSRPASSWRSAHACSPVVAAVLTTVPRTMPGMPNGS